MKVEPARWYYHCDRLGTLVWQDMPCGGKCSSSFCGIGIYLLNLKAFGDDRRYLWFGQGRSATVRENFKRELRAMLSN